MGRMSRTNYWNPSVNYIGMTSVQNFLNLMKYKKIKEQSIAMATDCSCPCSDGGCTACGCTCTSSCS